MRLGPTLGAAGAAFLAALVLSSPALGADACPSLTFQTTGAASPVHTRCAGADLNGVFQVGQAAQFSYTPPAGYRITSLDIGIDRNSYVGPDFTTYVVIDGQQQRFRGDVIPNLHASAVSVGIRCEAPSEPYYGDTGCGGDYFALSRFSVEMEMIPIPVSANSPQPCNRAQAHDAGVQFLEPYAVDAYPDYWADLASEHWLTDGVWRLSKVYCRDLTGDGQAEMVAMWVGGTGGSLQPWAIFQRDATGHWQMPYAQVRDTVYQMAFHGHTIVTPKVAVYEGAFTYKYRKRYVRWNGHQFTSRLGRVYKIHNPNRDR